MACPADRKAGKEVRRPAPGSGAAPHTREPPVRVRVVESIRSAVRQWPAVRFRGPLAAHARRGGRFRRLRHKLPGGVPRSRAPRLARRRATLPRHPERHGRP
ncbi:hypothetical protein Shyhy01_25280 [Streptomyces hygroscopicus subsp. hygroscopicus]|nr:hypothetical protein Shyhy01_25280 [Streptomyces hygroscopicus subsp. hygroscopicus]